MNRPDTTFRDLLVQQRITNRLLTAIIGASKQQLIARLDGLGATNEEIAEVVGTTPATVVTSLARARKAAAAADRERVHTADGPGDGPAVAQVPHRPRKRHAARARPVEAGPAADAGGTGGQDSARPEPPVEGTVAQLGGGGPEGTSEAGTAQAGAGVEASDDPGRTWHLDPETGEPVDGGEGT